MGKHTILLVPFSREMTFAKPADDVVHVTLTMKLDNTTTKIYVIDKQTALKRGGDDEEVMAKAFWIVKNAGPKTDGNMMYKDIELPLPTWKVNSPWASEGFAESKGSKNSGVLKMSALTNAKDILPGQSLVLKGKPQ